MNRIEAKALQWLAKTTGLPEHLISFSNNSSPDFTTSDRRGFEIKYHRQHGSIVFWPRQWAQLQQHPDCTILVFAEDEEPEAVIPVTQLEYGTKRWGYIPICYLTRCPGSDNRTMLRADYLRKVKRLKNEKAAEPVKTQQP